MCSINPTFCLISDTWHTAGHRCCHLLIPLKCLGVQVLWAQHSQCLCGTRCEKVSVLGGALGTRAVAEPVRDLSLGGAEGLVCLQTQSGSSAGQRWPRGWLGRGHRVCGVQYPHGYTPALSPQAPAEPYCPLHPISQPLYSTPSTQLPPTSPSTAQPILLVPSHKPFTGHSTF